MAKSSASTVLHACKPQRSAAQRVDKMGNGFEEFFHHNSRVHLLLRQSERWRMEKIEQGEEDRRQKMMDGYQPYHRERMSFALSDFFRAVY